MRTKAISVVSATFLLSRTYSLLYLSYLLTYLLSCQFTHLADSSGLCHRLLYGKHLGCNQLHVVY